MARNTRALAVALLVALAACGGTDAAEDPAVASFCDIHAEIEESAPGIGSSGSELETVWRHQMGLFERWPAVAPSDLKNDVDRQLAFMQAITPVYEDADFSPVLIDIDAMLVVNAEYSDVSEGTLRIADWVDAHC